MRRRAKGIIRKLKKVSKVVQRQMNMHDGGKYARGLAGEGYNGGYYAALQDVLLALNGVTPSRHGWWEDNEQ